MNPVLWLRQEVNTQYEDEGDKMAMAIYSFLD